MLSEQLQTPRWGCALLAVTALLFPAVAGAEEKGFPKVVNTQNPKDVPPTAEEAASKITVPPGFHVTLFAGDPNVAQPIAICVDDRGRLWVAESYTYSGGGGGKSWVKDHRDRILIFEDTDHDGHFDRRTVFWDQAQNLSGIATGFGGVWLLCAPHLLFLPDRNGDDRPDGEPEIILDGWRVDGVGHNIVNGLTWGPDGWLYGRHGIMATSLVGTPQTPPSERTKLNCSIWRYHPTGKRFEVVTNGTTNPWGFDHDDHGEMFFTNNVIGHLWHVIPGAHYKRMYGEDFNPHLYGLIDQHADHYHWDTGKSWTDSRDGKGEHGKLGGGHSHCGGMIYLGDSWPAHYRNTMFLCNTHGRRVNNDRLVRSGSGYVGLHEKDFLFANNPWFRGIDLKYGPDGGVYLSDWTDIGECHDHDGVHRTSGRIYKIVHGKPKRPTIGDVSKLNNAELVRLQLHANDYYVRVARRLLQERAAAGQEMKEAHKALLDLYGEQKDVTRKLRAMWALYVTEGAGEAWLRKQLGAGDEHIRSWAVRLLVDRGYPGAETIQEFVRLAREDESGLVRLYLASALQRLPLDQRAGMAMALLSHGKDAGDHNLPLMIWYGVEELVAKMPRRGVELARASRIPLVRELIARRLTEEIEKEPAQISALLKVAMEQSAGFQQDVLRGMTAALRGWRKAKPPAIWSEAQVRFRASDSEEARKLSRDLGVVFGDGRALAELRKIALDGNADGDARREALRVLIEGRNDDLLPVLRKLIQDRATAGVAARGLAVFDAPDTPKLLLSRYRYFRPEERSEVIGTLTSRRGYAEALLKAVEEGTVARGEISAFHARQILSLKDEKLGSLLRKVWGEIRSTPQEKKDLIARYKKMLTPEQLKKADLPRGRLVFDQVCANCHRLYGEGKTTAPDLTGSNRDNLDYLLENMADPSGVVPVDFKMAVVNLKSGRVLTGVLVEPTARTIAVQGQKERVVVERSEIEEITPTQLSLMPDGLLTPLSEEQIRDLIGYLMSRKQTARPMARGPG